jgi:hypothetical protein
MLAERGFGSIARGDVPGLPLRGALTGCGVCAPFTRVLGHVDGEGPLVHDTIAV